MQVIINGVSWGKGSTARNIVPKMSGDGKSGAFLCTVHDLQGHAPLDWTTEADGEIPAVSSRLWNSGSVPTWVSMASLSLRVLCPCTTASLLVSPSALRTAPSSRWSSCPSPSVTRSRLGVTATTRRLSTRQPRSIPTVSLLVGSSRCPRVPSRDSSPHQSTPFSSVFPGFCCQLVVVPGNTREL